MAVAPCGCPSHPGRRVTDPARHADWHAEAEAAGLPPGPVDARTMREAGGWKGRTLPGPTVLDEKAVLTGKRRSSAAAHAEARANALARQAALEGRTRHDVPEDRRAGA